MTARAHDVQNFGDITIRPSERSILAAVAVATLSLSSAVLFALQGVALFLREAGQPSDVVGLVFLAGVPWILRFLWAPLIDRFGPASFGRFRSWILGSQTAIIGILIALAFAKPDSGPYLVLALVALLCLAMGTQQTAIFGLLAAGLAPNKRIAGMTAQVLAYGLAGVLMGLGIVYFLADLGWRLTVLGLAGMTFVCLLALTPMRMDARCPLPQERATFRGMFAIFKRRGARRLLLITIFTNIGVSGTYGLQSLMLIDAGFSVANAGLIAIVGTSATGLLGGWLAKPVSERFGGYATVALVAVALAVSNISAGFLILEALVGWIVAAVALVNGGLSFALLPAAKSILMDFCCKGREATDFASFAGVEVLVFMIGTSLLAGLADTWGYAIILMTTGLASLVGSALAWRTNCLRSSVAQG